MSRKLTKTSYRIERDLGGDFWFFNTAGPGPHVIVLRYADHGAPPLIRACRRIPLFLARPLIYAYTRDLRRRLDRERVPFQRAVKRILRGVLGHRVNRASVVVDRELDKARSSSLPPAATRVELD